MFEQSREEPKRERGRAVDGRFYIPDGQPDYNSQTRSAIARSSVNNRSASPSPSRTLPSRNPTRTGRQSRTTWSPYRRGESTPTSSPGLPNLQSFLSGMRGRWPSEEPRPSVANDHQYLYTQPPLAQDESAGRLESAPHSDDRAMQELSPPQSFHAYSQPATPLPLDSRDRDGDIIMKEFPSSQPFAQDNRTEAAASSRHPTSANTNPVLRAFKNLKESNRSMSYCYLPTTDNGQPVGFAATRKNETSGVGMSENTRQDVQCTLISGMQRPRSDAVTLSSFPSLSTLGSEDISHEDESTSPFFRQTSLSNPSPATFEAYKARKSAEQALTKGYHRGNLSIPLSLPPHVESRQAPHAAQKQCVVADRPWPKPEIQHIERLEPDPQPMENAEAMPSYPGHGGPDVSGISSSSGRTSIDENGWVPNFRSSRSWRDTAVRDYWKSMRVGSPVSTEETPSPINGYKPGETKKLNESWYSGPVNFDTFSPVNTPVKYGLDWDKEHIWNPTSEKKITPEGDQERSVSPEIELTTRSRSTKRTTPTKEDPSTPTTTASSFADITPNVLSIERDEDMTVTISARSESVLKRTEAIHADLAAYCGVPTLTRTLNNASKRKQVVKIHEPKKHTLANRDSQADPMPSARTKPPTQRHSEASAPLTSINLPIRLKKSSKGKEKENRETETIPAVTTASARTPGSRSNSNDNPSIFSAPLSTPEPKMPRVSFLLPNERIEENIKRPEPIARSESLRLSNESIEGNIKRLKEVIEKVKKESIDSIGENINGGIVGNVEERTEDNSETLEESVGDSFERLEQSFERLVESFEVLEENLEALEEWEVLS